MDSIVHIYAQYAPHSDAIILSNEEGLVALRKAIDIAISSKGTYSPKVFVFCNDGEGYSIKIGCIEDEKTLDSIPVPYTAEGFLSNPSNYLDGKFF